MKISFTVAELAWLNRVVVSMVLLGDGISDTPIMHIWARMRHKFSPNATVSYLTQKERGLIYAVAEFRHSKLQETGGLAQEAPLVAGIMEKVK